MIDVSDETTRTLGHAFAEALAKVEAASYTDRRRLAATSDDEAILIVLSEKVSDDYDADAVRMLLQNEHTPLIALKKITNSRTAEYASEISQMESTKKDLETTPSEDAILSVMQHRNADERLLASLSKHLSWKIRYGVAMQPRTMKETLKELAEDQDLAVRAMASKRLGLPAIDDGLGVQPNCLELNQAFERIRRNLFSSKKLADTLAKQFMEGVDDEKFDYSGAEHFHRSCVEALKELKTRVVHLYMSRVRAKHLPNLDLSSHEEKIPKLMDVFDDTHFDAYIMATKLRKLIDQRTALSLSELRKDARELLPYVTDTRGWSYGHGPANKPEQILDGKRLKLRAYFSHIGEYSSVDYKIVRQVQALDKLSTVISTQADPATVRSYVSEILASRRGSRQIFQKIVIDNGGIGLLTVRFYKNGTFIAEYASSEDAEKVAKALVSTPPTPC